VLCLDLSESMNQTSGVSRLAEDNMDGDLEGDVFDHEVASFKLLGDLAEGISDKLILENGEI
jgi:hypothetical protein